MLFLIKVNAQVTGNDPSCQETFFFNLYYSADSYSRHYDLIPMQDSGVIAVGERRNNIEGDLVDGLITRFDKQGAITWNKTIEGPGTQVITSIVQLADGNLAAFGVQVVSANLGYFFLKLDVAGNILWRKDYQIQNVAERFGGCRIKEDRDGSLIVTGQFLENGLSFNDRVFFLKSDADGNLLRSHFFKTPGSFSFINVNDMILGNGYTYVVGGYYTDGIKGLLIKIDNSNGNFVWSKYYNFNGQDAEFLQVFPYSNNQLCIVGQDDLNAKDTSLMMIIDTAGICTSSNYFQFNTGLPRQFGSAAQTANHDLIWAMYYYRSPSELSSFTLSRIHPENGIIYSKDFRQIDGLPIIHKTIIGLDSSIYSTGFKGDATGEYPLFLGKFSNNGELGCPSNPISAKFSSGTTTSTPLPMTVTTRTYPALPSVNYSGDHEFTVNNICQTISFCNTLKIHGQDTLCDLQSSLTITAYKNAECILPVSWQLDNTAVQSMTATNDTTLRILFSQNWQGYLYATIETSCGILKDSIWLTVLDSPGQVDLGGDRNLCPGNSVVLNAGRGYKSYLWQDGSADSQFTVTSPGVYWVHAIDACNISFQDTIAIAASPAIPFDLGSDLIKCNSDSVTVTAPAGFINYSWSPDYNITSVSGQSVTMFPSLSIMYKVSAEKTPGCFAYDSIYITVNKSAPIFLGQDTSFCLGNSMILNAGTGFSSYSWNTGQADPSIVVNTPGTYSVAAIDPNLCISRDTLSVLNVFDNPVVALPKDSLLCTGSSRTFSVAPGMASYHWNTGSISNSITTNTTGVYWVDVVDNNGCPATDTARIAKILPLPKDFLPADTALCSYSTMQLNASGVYHSYLWNTGSRQPSITINDAGVYSLQVVDNFSCTGTDTIVVNLKQCQEGFFIPNAFTPTKDGLNDDFRPLLFGIVRQYRFKIYNRWGQLVFESSTLGKGWDGKIGGRDTDSNIFVWTCEFQFEGQKSEFKKGTVLLIR